MFLVSLYNTLYSYVNEILSFRKIALVMLQWPSRSSLFPSQENLKVLDSPPERAGKNVGVAFIAKNFTQDDFKNNELEILLLGDNRRRKRAAHVRVPLTPNASYIIAQRNEYKIGVSIVAVFFGLKI